LVVEVVVQNKQHHRIVVVPVVQVVVQLIVVQVVPEHQVKVMRVVQEVPLIVNGWVLVAVEQEQPVVILMVIMWVALVELELHLQLMAHQPSVLEVVAAQFNHQVVEQFMAVQVVTAVAAQVLQTKPVVTM
jgi:hypothetical protein